MQGRCLLQNPSSSKSQLIWVKECNETFSISSQQVGRNWRKPACIFDIYSSEVQFCIYVEDVSFRSGAGLVSPKLAGHVQNPEFFRPAVFETFNAHGTENFPFIAIRGDRG